MRIIAKLTLSTAKATLKNIVTVTPDNFLTIITGNLLGCSIESDNISIDIVDNNTLGKIVQNRFTVSL